MERLADAVVSRLRVLRAVARGVALPDLDARICQRRQALAFVSVSDVPFDLR
jgi:hypothetical protein